MTNENSWHQEARNLLREGIFPVIMRATLQQAAGRVQTFSKQASGNLPGVIKQADPC
jgi:hypothetical protein